MKRAVARVVCAFVLVVATLVAIVAGPTGPASAAPTVIVVNTTSDAPDSNFSDGICRTSSGECSLRAAILTANVRAGDDRIEFDIPGSGTKTIQVSGSLPDVYDPSGRLTIDGYTQGDARPNTAADGSNARIRVQLRGSGSYGIRLTSAENTIRGLSIAGFTFNIAIHFEQADGNLIIGNFIGPDANGNQVNGSSAGVHIWLGPDWNRIGTPALADRNVVSGNGSRGFLIEQGNTSRNTVQNNVIGLNPSLTNRLSQRDGLDIQWGTWGNLVGGENPGEGNLISGNQLTGFGNWGGVDLSHSAESNLIIGNYIGTLADGNSATTFSRNANGILMKDNAQNNYVANNVIANSQWHGIQSRHNFTGPSSWVNNRIGVGINGASLPNAGINVRVNGHDDIYYGNIVGNGTQGGFVVIDETFNDGNTNFPPEQTLGNRIRYSTFYGNAGPQIDISPNYGQLNNDDNGDGDDGPHGLLNRPVFTGAGAGQIYGTACAGCEVEIYLSGAKTADGSIDIGSSAIQGAAWMATAVANGNGRWSLADSRMQVGKRVWAIAIDPAGNTSEWTAGGINIPSTPYGILGNPAPGLGQVAAPARPALPGPYVSQLPAEFTCSQSGGSLTWVDAGASAYYVFAVTNGVEQYLGGHSTTSLTVPDADSYRVEHWKFGGATNASCDFTSGGAVFSCSVSGGTLSWGNVGAAEYYVFATSGGVERYLGGHQSTNLNVQAADSYRVEHWAGNGATNANCAGAGAVVFDCSVAGGTLSWADVGAAEYYVFATTGGAEQYLGGHVGTSLSVAAADSYRVEHWVSGSVTNAVCG